MSTAVARPIRHGFMAAVVGHLAIATVITVGDLLGGHPFLFTPSVLGSVLLDRATNVCALTPAIGPILAYAALHLAVLTGFGLVASYLARSSERRPQFWFGALLLFIVIGWHLGAFVLAMLGPVEGCIGLGWIVAASFVGAAAMAVYLWRVHPWLRADLRTDRYA